MASEVAGPDTERATIRIYGASDDLIEVEGDLREEFNVLSQIEDGPVYIGISNGTLIRVTYDGFWNLHVLKEGSTGVVGHRKATDLDDDFSDMVTITGPIEWVVCAGEGVYAE